MLLACAPVRPSPSILPLVATFVVTLALPAAAEVVVPPPDATDGTGIAPDATPPARPPARRRAAPVVRHSHQGQVLASVRTGVGLRAIVPYQKATFCGDVDLQTSSGNAPVCAGRAPLSLDLELGYGVGRQVDLFLETRIGLESDFGSLASSSEDGPTMFHLSPGARFYFADGSSTKLFTTAQFVLDFSGYEDPGTGDVRGADIGFRNMSGIWVDLAHNYGFYGYIGETLTFARWLRFELEAGVGFQVRYP